MEEILDNLRDKFDMESLSGFTDRAAFDLSVLFTVLYGAEILGQNISQVLDFGYFLGVILVVSLPSIAFRASQKDPDVRGLIKNFLSQYSDLKARLIELRSLDRVERYMELSNSIFEQLLLTYLVLLLIETVWEGSVSNYLDLTYLMAPVILTGVISMFSDEEEESDNKALEMKDYLLIGAMGVLGGAAVFYKTRDIGMVSYLVSALSGLLIILLSVIVLEEDKEVSESSKEVKDDGDS